MADPPIGNGSVESNASLAMMLRECADAIERNELSPVVYQTWGALHAFVKQNGGGTQSRVTKTTTRHIPATPQPESTPDTSADNVFSAEASADFAEDKPFDESSPPRQTTHSSESNDATSTNHLGSKSKDVFSNLGGFSKKLGKQFGLHPTKHPASESQKQATSKKNSERFKADLASEVASAAADESTDAASVKKPSSSDTFRTSASTTSGPSATNKKKPSFHRPTNPNTTLIANGWVEQQRRSKMRFAWKEVLASLVEGRTPQEETTLWIQRQITNAQGKPELEALHQIPMKWLESVAFVDFSADNRFTVKVFNLAEEFQFRCADAESAQNWVITLRSVSDIVKKQKPGQHDGNIREVVGNLNDWGEGSTVSNSHTERSSHRMTVKELQAIAHGAGYNTSGMERAELERLVTSIAMQRTPSVDVEAEQRHKQEQERHRLQQEEERRKQQEEEHVRRQPQDPEPSRPRRPISELQSIAHAAGYSTSGMERTELERLVASLSVDETDTSPQHRPDPEPSHPRKTISELQAIAHGAGYNTSGMERAELERLVAKIDADEANLQKQKDAALEAQRRRQQHQEDMHRKQEEERQRRAALEADQKRRQAEEERQRRAALEAEQQRRQAEEERRRAAEAEDRKRQEEQRRLLEEHQKRQAAAAAAAAEQQRRQEEEMRRRVAEQQAAVERRQKEQAEEQRKRQEWQRSQWQAQQAAQAAQQRAEWEKKWQEQQRQQQQQYAQPQPAYQGQPRPTQQQPPPFNAAPPPQNKGYRPPPPQAPGYKPPPPPSGGYNPPPAPPPPPQNHPASPADMKYAKMADQSDDTTQAAITNIKRNLLLNWALQPPMNQILRPIDALITTIHTVFPPAFGVAGHEYFKKWTPIARDSIVTGPAMGGAPDDAKLKKAVRKLRFFLHPDKLPRDLNDEQSFMCKMLWDVISDAWEEFHKKNEELGWIHN